MIRVVTVYILALTALSAFAVMLVTGWGLTALAGLIGTTSIGTAIVLDALSRAGKLP